MIRFRSPLQNELGRIRRKIQLERLLKGAGVVCAVVLVASILASVVLSRNNFSDMVLFWTRLISGIALVVLALKFLLFPLLRRPTAGKIARFLEERNPKLEERLSTAVEIAETPSRAHPVIGRLIQEDARVELRKIVQPRLYYPQTSWMSMLALGASALVFISLFWAGPQAYRYSLDKLIRGWWVDDQAPLYSIEVQPGNTQVVRHADVEIRAALLGFVSENVKLLAKYENQPAWEETSMRPDPNGNEFVFLLFDVRDQVEYYVEAEGIRSDRYTITVSDVPTVARLEIRLTFPRHTRLEPELKEDDGDIRALVGTRADFTIRTDQPVKAGIIKLEEGGELPLEPTGPQVLQGTFKITRDDFYRIHLQNLEEVWNPSSDEYLIEALNDQPPSVSFARPGRDKRVTNLEEVFAQVKASDDYGLRRLNLHYSVNGQLNQQVELSVPRDTRNTTASHTFYLEEFDLEPGDFVSYYAEASDAVSSSQTDIYFLEVQPYDREYYQSQQAGGGGMGGASNDLMLSKLEKEIIAATFNVIRVRDTYTRQEFEENVQTVALMQQQIQQQAETIVERIQRRGAVARDPLFVKMVENLKGAIEHMIEAHRHLNELQPDEALTPEQKALQKLLRAESLFKEIQIAMGGGQGGGGSASAEELADLVDLELDQKKNQYETLQQNRQLSRDQKMDDLAQKLKELAQRQQQEVERRRRQAAQQGSGGGSSQQELLEEVEQLARQLERLSREQRDQQLNSISRQLRQAARDLRRSQSGDNPQEAQLQAQRALERLQQARDALGRQRETEMKDSIERLAAESSQLEQRQDKVLESIRDLEQRQQAGKVDGEWMRDLNQNLREKMDLQEDVQRLETDLHQTARRLAGEQPEASRKLKEAGINIRDQRIPEKMQEGSELMRRGWTGMAVRREENVAEGLKQLTQSIEEAQNAMGPGQQQSSPAERAEKALNQIGNLVEDLESLRERLARAQQERSGAPGSETPEGQEQGEAQQPGEGQPGEEPSSQQSDRSGRSPRGQQPGQQGDPSESQAEGSQPSGQSGESDQTAGSQQGAPSESGGAARTTPLGGSLANSRGIDPQSFGREWQERVRDAEELRDLVRTLDPRQARDIAALARRMRELDAARVFDDAEEIARLKSQIIDGFRELELQLYRGLKPDAERLSLAHEDEVPPEFRSRVEEYYRSLAERQKQR